MVVISKKAIITQDSLVGLDPEMIYDAVRLWLLCIPKG